MDIAVKYEKFDLGEEKYVFKPVCIIKGTYDEEIEMFITEYGDLCFPIEGDSQYEDNYFGSLTNMEEIREVYGEMSDEDALSEFFDACKDNYTIGYYDSMNAKLQIIHIPYASVEESLEKSEETYEMINSDVRIILNLEKMNELKEINDIDQLHEKLDEIIHWANIAQESGEDESLNNYSPKVEEDSKKTATKKNESQKITLKELREEVKESILGQDEAVDDVTRAIIINDTSKNPRNKSHIFITGPSGTGKTEMVNIIADKLNLPVFKASATDYSKTGYQGKEVNSMLAGLVEAAGGNLERAQRGILIIDEMDKVVLGSSTNKNFDMAVLYALLKIMDRDVIEVDLDHHRSVLFDTSNLNIIFMGAFDAYLREKEKYEEKHIGFNSSNEVKGKKSDRMTEEDLIKNFGTEFVGRLGLVTSTEELDVETVVEILYKSKISQLRVIKEDLLDRGVELEVEDEYVREMAKNGSSRKTGVRNLNKNVKDNFKFAYDDVLTKGKVKKLIFTKETASNPKKYCME